MLSLIPKDARKFYDFIKTTSSSEYEDDVDGFGESVDFDILEFEDRDEEQTKSSNEKI